MSQDNLFSAEETPASPKMPRRPSRAHPAATPAPSSPAAPPGPRVLNKRVSADGVYIGRPSKFGNRFVIGEDGNRDTVIMKYEAWLRSNPALIEAAKQELRGKNLVCWCAPRGCHGDVLLRIANE